MEIENPLTEEFAFFRSSILPNLLSALADSKNEKLPIKLYEAGPVATPTLAQSLSFASMHSKANFSEIKGVVMALLENMRKRTDVRAEDYGAFMPGRCAALVIDGNVVGHFGEIAPEVLSAFGLEQPVCACEIQDIFQQPCPVSIA